VRARLVCGHHGDSRAPRSTLSPAIAAAIAGVIFGIFAAPGLTWLDAGELGAAAWEAGVAHPPGMPVFTQIHGLIMHALPIGDAAFRGNLASAFLGCVTIAGVTQTARTLGARALPAVCGGLLTALNGLFLLHATTIEVYTGAAAWVAIALWLIARIHRQKERGGTDARDIGLLGLWVGLAAGHHAELRLFVLAAVPLILLKARGRRLAIGLGAAMVGGLCLAYLPLRSSTELWRDWGDPSSMGALWDHLMGSRIRAAYGDQMGQLTDANAAVFGGQLIALAPGLLLLGLLGMVRGVRVPAARWLVVIWVLDTLYSIFINPMGLRDFQNGVPGLVALGIGAALALDNARGRFTTPLLAVACMFGALPGILDSQLRTDRGLMVLMEAADSGAAPEALAFVASDNYAAGYAFRQVVEGARPDMAVIVRQHARYASSVGPVVRRLPAAMAGWRAQTGLQSLEHLSAPRQRAPTDSAGPWPVVWEWATGLDATLAPADLRPAVPWFRRVPGDGPSAVLGWLNRARVGPQGRNHYGAIIDDLTRWYIARDVDKAVGAGRSATLVNPANAARWINLGQALLRRGDIEKAIISTLEALKVEPGSRLAQLNLARMILAREPVRTMALLDSIIADDEDVADAYGMRGVLHAQTGNMAAARIDWQRALSLDPTQAEAVVGMAKLGRR
jgi:hypothetical protein